jgi:hypothetical protein
MIHSLDILAIAIFSITMLALLGPVVGISPFVPVIVTVLLLGGYGLDRAIWQSKAGDFAMAWLRRRSPQFRQQVLYHEAGHFLAAQLLGMKILGYRVTSSGKDRFGSISVGEMPVGVDSGVAVEGIMEFGLEANQFPVPKSQAPKSQESLEQNYLDRCCTVWMAGVAAEQIFCADGLEYDGGAEDMRQLRAAIAAQPTWRQEPDLEQRWALLRAKVLLRDHSDAFYALVAKMEEGADLTDCFAAIANPAKNSKVDILTEPKQR